MIWYSLIYSLQSKIKVDQHSVLNRLNHEDSAIKWKIYILGVKKWRKKYMLTYSFFCYWTSTEGTYHRQFWKCARSPMFRSWAKILLFLSNEIFQVLIFENMHITKSYIIKFLVNIWNHGKNLQDLSGQNPWWNGGLL